MICMCSSLHSELPQNKRPPRYGSGFGVGRKHFTFTPIHCIATPLEPETFTALLFLHAFSGCDTISSFNKDKARNRFAKRVNECLPVITPVFHQLVTSEDDISETDKKLLEPFPSPRASISLPGHRVR